MGSVGKQVSRDPFETVVVGYSQPQAAVLMSMFEWYGIPAYAQNIETVRSNTPLTLALGGIPIRVRLDAVADARALLTDAAGGGDPPPAPPVARRVTATLSALACFLLGGGVPPPKLSAALIERS